MVMRAGLLHSPGAVCSKGTAGASSSTYFRRTSPQPLPRIQHHQRQKITGMGPRGEHLRTLQFTFHATASESGGSGGGGVGDGPGDGGGGGEGGGHSWGDQPNGGMGGGSRAIVAGLLLGAFASLNKWLILWCTDPELTSRVAALLDAGFLSFLGPLAAAIIFIGPTWTVPASQVLLGAAFTHLLGEMLLSAAQPGAAWQWDLWVHHICSCGLIASALLLRVPAFATDGLRLLVVECTTGVVAAFSEARKTKRLSGNRSSALGILMLVGFTFRWVWTSSLLQKYLVGGTLQSILAAGGVLPAVLTTAAIVPLWALNFYWASRVYQSAAKVFSQVQLSVTS